MKHFLSIALFCAGGLATGRGQVTATLPVTAASPVGGAPILSKPTTSAAVNTNTAIQALSQGNLDLAESALTHNAFTRADTTARQLDLAHQLAAMAFAFEGVHNHSTALLAAQRALAHLDTTKAIWGGSDSISSARAFGLAGVLQETILHDSAAAEAAYVAAMRLDPAYALVKQRLRHLQEIKSILAAKLSHG